MKYIKEIKYFEVLMGSDLISAAKEAIDYARENYCTIELKFNGFPIRFYSTDYYEEGDDWTWLIDKYNEYLNGGRDE